MGILHGHSQAVLEWAQELNSAWYGPVNISQMALSDQLS